MLCFRHSAVALLIAALVTPASAQDATSPIAGRWRGPDGAIVRVEACANRPELTCAVVEADSPGSEPSLVGQNVLQDMRADGPRRWKGRYVVPDANYSATLRLTSPDTIVFRVCAVAFMCDAETYTRLPVAQ